MKTGGTQRWFTSGKIDCVGPAQRLKRQGKPPEVTGNFSTQNGLTFDYVIVGAGSSGAVLANRLSADPGVTVCLIEAGPTDQSAKISMPLGVVWLSSDKTHNWLFKSTPQAALNGREVSIPRGKVLGGSSAINGMIYIRGHRADYDNWAELGCTGWNYDAVLPYFKKSEANSDAAKSPDFHGLDGPLSVANQRDSNPMDMVFAEAANQLQFQSCEDFNAPEPEGVGIYQVTQRDGRRESTGAAFLTPIRKRTNLRIITGAEAQRVDVTDGRATGVTLRRNGQTEQLRARAEVILSAGTIGSPDILIRSGIGAAEMVRGIGGAVIADLPGVGQNLQDHVDAMVICKTKSIHPYGISLRAAPRLALDGIRWLTARRGMLSSNMVEAGGFLRSSPNEPRPDIQLHFIPGRKSHRGRKYEYGHGVSLHTCLLRPESIGSVTRVTPDGPPQIDLGLLSNEADVTRLTTAIKLARRILQQQPFEQHGLSEILPGLATQSDDEIAAFIRDHARTVYHPVGTCAMGTGPMAVTDARLRVHGIRGLRVVDASIMPKIVSGNTNAPAIMIAEKAADMIKEDARAA
jgi:choline dehydrogenase-like flavoprotein